MLLEFIELNTNEKGSLYNTLYLKIKDAVLRGAIKNGEKLPSVREAAAQLNVSRTTVENAYEKLCIEGIAESFPQKGYYIIDFKNYKETFKIKKEEKNEFLKYDFSGRSVDTFVADTEVWKKTVRNVLLDFEELTSYGDSQGELVLREELSSYIYKSRGVVSRPENIIIGAGIGPLLNILCGLIGRNVKIGFENYGFKQAESVFLDYGINYSILKSDSNGALINSIRNNSIDKLFLTPSMLSKISVTALSKRRNQYVDWVKEDDRRLIIEDDYNGELRFNARTVPAFQSKIPEKTVYIGSFSKLLLPSVRLAFMILPDSLTEIFLKRKNDFNQTCGKIEQLALSKYISSGNLEKHLRKLRRYYNNKSQILISELKKEFPTFKTVIYETSLTVELQTTFKIESSEICDKLLENKIKVIKSLNNGSFKLSFSGIKKEDISFAVKEIKSIFEKNW